MSVSSAISVVCARFASCPSCTSRIFVNVYVFQLDGAEQMYAAAARGPPSVRVLTLYATFMQTRRRDLDAAERLFCASLLHGPCGGACRLSLLCLCVLSAWCAGKATTVDAHDANALTNLATFLKDVRGDVAQAAEMYERALAIDPAHAAANYNFGALLHSVFHEHDRAQACYEAALKVTAASLSLCRSLSYPLCCRPTRAMWMR